jgi:hypothetical protein
LVLVVQALINKIPVSMVLIQLHLDLLLSVVEVVAIVIQVAVVRQVEQVDLVEVEKVILMGIVQVVQELLVLRYRGMRAVQVAASFRASAEEAVVQVWLVIMVALPSVVMVVTELLLQLTELLFIGEVAVAVHLVD